MKVTKKSNYRIVVEPITHVCGIYLGDHEIKTMANEIRDQIKRHVDGIGSVYIEFDTDVTCSHCGLNWEVDEEAKEPVCCEKAIEEFKRENIVA